MTFPALRAGLAMACADMSLRFAPAADVDHWSARSEEAARAALDLDPDLAEAHLARAAVARKREFDWNATVAASRRATLLNPNLDQAHFFVAAAYYHLGYMQEALIEAQKGRALRGGDTVEPIRIEALVALFSGDFAPAIARLEEVSRLSSQPIGDTYLAMAAYYSGGRERARTMLEALAGQPSLATATRSRAALASILAAQGQTDAARAQIAREAGHPERAWSRCGGRFGSRLGKVLLEELVVVVRCCLGLVGLVVRFRLCASRRRHQQADNDGRTDASHSTTSTAPGPVILPVSIFRLFDCMTRTRSPTCPLPDARPMPVTCTGPIRTVTSTSSPDRTTGARRTSAAVSGSIFAVDGSRRRTRTPPSQAESPHQKSLRFASYASDVLTPPDVNGRPVAPGVAIVTQRFRPAS